MISGFLQRPLPVIRFFIVRAAGYFKVLDACIDPDAVRMYVGAYVIKIKIKAYVPLKFAVIEISGISFFCAPYCF